MQRGLQAAWWTLIGGALGSIPQSWALTAWFTTGAAAVLIVLATGPVAYMIGARQGRRRAALIAVIALVSGVLCAAGAEIGLRLYQREHDAEEKQRAEVQALHQQVANANRRAELAEALQGRRLAKYQTANSRIADALSAGGSLRYALESERNAAAIAGSLRAFDDVFDTTSLVSRVERWRAETARMLDDELPGARLGGWFSEIDGARGVGRSGYQLTKVIECIDGLRAIQRDLRSHVEQIIQ